MAIKTRREFCTLVRKLEEFSKKDPGAYKLRVTLLALLGYFYIALVVVVCLALLALLIYGIRSGKAVTFYGKLIFIVLAFLYLIIRSLWVRIEPPGGITLRKSDFPGLFGLLDELTEKLKAPRYDEVLLTDEFNAGVIQVPRLGIFGWYKNYIILGVPLMESLTPAQFTAVLAHEMGHLSGNHSRFGVWIYRVRAAYDQITEGLNSDQHWGSFIFNPFFNWYAPFFAAYSLVYARANEYDADR